MLARKSTQDKHAEQIASGDTLLQFDMDVWREHDRFKENNLRVAGLLSEKNKTILDFGCGPGTFAAILARQNTVFGIDIAGQAVRNALFRARKEKIDLSGAIMDGELQGFAPAVFDIELSSWALHHFPNLYVPLKQLFKSLKPGGELVIIEPNESAFPQRISRAIENALRSFVLGAGLDTPNRTTHTKKEYIDALENIGFSVKHVFSHYSGERAEIPNNIRSWKRQILKAMITMRHLLFTFGCYFGSGAEIFIVANKRDTNNNSPISGNV